MPVHSPLTILGRVGGLLLVAAVVKQCIDGALREERAQRERHVGRLHHLLQGQPHGGRKPAATELLGERNRPPARLDVGVVRLAELLGEGHRAVRVAHGTHGVTDAVGGGNHLGHKVGCLREEVNNCLKIGVLEARQRCQVVVSHNVLKDERDVGCWGSEVTHDHSVGAW